MHFDTLTFQILKCGSSTSYDSSKSIFLPDLLAALIVGVAYALDFQSGKFKI
jgi:hypothetical protein